MLRVAVVAASLLLFSVAVPSKDALHHPMLYFSQSDIKSLRQKATGSHAAIFHRIERLVNQVKDDPSLLDATTWETFGSHWNEEYGNRLATLAFYALLRPEDKQMEGMIFQAMDHMASYPDWKVKASPLDEVPVSHSLIGFATAFDFLYNRLSKERRKTYVETLDEVSSFLYDRASKAWWGRSYVQNHVATNTVALLSGAIVLGPHLGKRTTVWRQYAVQHLGRTMQLLDLVVDGSMDEGTGYGSYTTRSLTQYAFLMKRHMQINVLSGRFWLRQYFDFTLGTALPGYKEIIGIGDSADTWFYGPESQLVFLDAFVLKSGHGNWLAAKIRKQRQDANTNRSGNGMDISTLHTEYIWYNPSIGESTPDFKSLMRFSDAGLVTYNGGTEAGKTFLSFKSGPLHGRGVYVAVENKTYPWLTGWRGSVNPGHEHPDENSFVFYPRGKPFITDNLYGPKYSFLNNVLTFGPSRTSKCFGPSEGQLGECGHWLDWKSRGVERAWAEVIEASREGDMVFTSGEAVGAYNSKMKLRSVYRAVILLNDDVLLVVDHVDVMPGSELSGMNAYFHSRTAPFQIVGNRQAALTIDGENYFVDWTSGIDSDLESRGMTGLYDQPRGRGYIRTHFLNLSQELDFPRTRVAYLFRGAGVGAIKRFNMINSPTGVTVFLSFAGGKSYRVKVVTEYRSVEKRREFLGFLGYGSVNTINRETVQFGVQLNSNATNTGMPFFRWRNGGGRGGNLTTIQSIFLAAAIVVAILTLLISSRLERKPNIRHFFAFVLFFSCLSLPLYYYQAVNLKLGRPVARKLPPLPALFVTSLSDSGVDLIEAAFKNDTDIFYTRLQSSPLSASVPFVKDEFSESCEGLPRLAKPPTLGDWFRAYFTRPEILFWNAPVSRDLDRLRKIRREYPGSVIALVSGGQNMNLKVPSILNKTGDFVRAIYIVRDPRSWVAWAMQRGSWPFEERLQVMFNLKENHCDVKERYPNEYRALAKSIESKGDSGIQRHVRLALLWQANTEAALRINSPLKASHYQMMRFEDIVRKPVEMARQVYNFVGLPFPMAAEHRILQATRSRIFNPPQLMDWKGRLLEDEIKDVERICEETMKKLGYSI